MLLFYVLTYAISLFILIAIMTYAWIYKDKQGAKVMIVTMGFLMLWNTTALFEVYAQGIEAKLFWRNAQQISGFMLPYLIFFFAAAFIDNKRILHAVPYFAIFPIGFTVLIYTNPYHALVRSGYSLVTIANGHEVTNVEVTALGAVNVFLNMGFVVIAVVLLMTYYQKAINKVQKQIGIMVSALVLTIGLVVFNNFILRPNGIQIQTSTFYFPGIVMLAYALFKHDVFAVSPLSKDKLLESINQPIIVSDASGLIIEHNEAAEAFVHSRGFASIDILESIHALFDTPLFVRMHNYKNQKNIQEMLVKTSEGMEYFNVHYHPLNQEGVYTGMLLHIENITAKKTYELALKRRADHDQYTGLLNRSTFQKSYETMPENSKVMILMDVDDFKRVNDTFGHHFGDIVLKTLAERFDALKDTECIVGRLGGEEFAFACFNKERTEALQMAEAIRRSVFDTPFKRPDGMHLSLTISVGVAFDSIGTKPFDAIRNEADTALYQAKKNEKNRVEVFGNTNDN